MQSFREGKYQAVLTELSSHGLLSAEELGQLGISHLRLGQFEQAEPLLLRAYLRGDLEAAVEYGNVLRLMGKLEEAKKHFEKIEQKNILEGELLYRAWQWHGVTLYLLGESQNSLKYCEESWHGFLSLDLEVQAARVAQNLAVIHEFYGDLFRAVTLRQQIIEVLGKDEIRIHLMSLYGLVIIKIYLGLLDDASNYLEIAESLSVQSEYPRSNAFILLARAYFYQAKGEYSEYYQSLQKTQKAVEKLKDQSLDLWLCCQWANYYSLEGDHIQASRTLNSYAYQNTPPEWIFARGQLSFRRKDYPDAIIDLQQAIATLTSRFDKLEAKMYLAATYHHMRDSERAFGLVREVLEVMLRLNIRTLEQMDKRDLGVLLQAAKLEPELEIYLEPLYPAPTELPSVHTLELVTLDDAPEIRLNGKSLGKIRSLSAVLLAYLALRPDRSKADILLEVFSERDESSANNNLKATLFDLRSILGKEAILSQGQNRTQARYNINPNFVVKVDIHAFQHAIMDLDWPTAFSIYSAPFLKGFEGSFWVDQKRHELAESMLLSVQKTLGELEQARNWPKMMLLCTQYLERDPLAYEVHQIRVQAAQNQGDLAKLARFRSEYQNALRT
jgi:tetratricopeptide (TPR) repeat protein/DNA-binding SARP family transcriptional activator